MRGEGWDDSKLLELLRVVDMEYLITRKGGGWDVVDDWSDILSGGEKQRTAMARLFYHSPQFAILDECTSQVSVDVEGKMYEYCKGEGITLFSVSHRKTLWQHHEFVLQFLTDGEYEFKVISEERRRRMLGGDEEEDGSEENGQSEIKINAK